MGKPNGFMEFERPDNSACSPLERIKNYNELTIDGKNHAYKQTNAILKPNTTVTCLNVYIGDNEIWLKIPSRFCLFILSW